MDVETASLQDDLADPGSKDEHPFDERRPLSKELEIHVPDGFTLGVVGDCIISRPLAPHRDREPAFAAVMGLLGGCDVTVGNLETTIVDARTFRGAPYAWDGDWTLVSQPSVAEDLAELGFDLLSRANNHALDWGLEGMRETSRWLDEAGLVHAGTGERHGIARAPQYLESPAGRVSLVSFASTFRPTTNTLAPRGAAPGRPGLSALRLNAIHTMPPAELEPLRSIAGNVGGRLADIAAAPPRRTIRSHLSPLTDDVEIVEAFGQRFAALEAEEPYRTTFSMDAVDVAEILRVIRQGTQHSDFCVAAIHSHESSAGVAPHERPGDFLSTLARLAIRAGTSAFVTTGIHHIGPIEIVEGRPVFYGLGNFVWSDMQEPVPFDLYEGNADLIEKAFAHPDRATDADLTNVMNAQHFADPTYFRGIAPVCTYERGALREVRVTCLDMGYGLPLTRSGIPRLASAAVADEILRHLIGISAPYGTTIEVRATTVDGIATKVGVIVAP